MGGGGDMTLPEETSLDNVAFLYFLAQTQWGMTNCEKILRMSQDKNYDYLLGFHPPWGILACDITLLFPLVPKTRWDPVFSMVKVLSCLLVPGFQTAHFMNAARDVSFLKRFCLFRHVCLELFTMKWTMYSYSQKQKGKNNCRRQSPSLAFRTLCTALFLLWKPCLCSPDPSLCSSLLFFLAILAWC